MSRRGYISVETEVDIDVSECLPEIDTQDLIDELKERGEFDQIPTFDDPIKLRKYIASLLGLHEWDYNNKKRFFERIEEIFLKKW